MWIVSSLHTTEQLDLDQQVSDHFAIWLLMFQSLAYRFTAVFLSFLQ